MVGVILIAGMAVLALGAQDIEPDYEATARAYVDRCLADPNVFVVNPPADRNPYRNMSNEQIHELMSRCWLDGGILTLHVNGLPALFKRRLAERDREQEKCWHLTGRLAWEEVSEGGRLVNGAYYDANGQIISEVIDGTGTKTIMSRESECYGCVCGRARYVDGLKDGVKVTYWSCDPNQLREEVHYSKGAVHGISRRWNRDGTLSAERSYKQGKQHAEQVHWYPNGKVRSRCEYRDGKQVGKYVRYYDNGQQAEERTGTCERRWYRSGQLMFSGRREPQGPGEGRGRLQEARTYDHFGNETGRVVNGSGVLVRFKEKDIRPHFRLVRYAGGLERGRDVSLPAPRVSADCGSETVGLTVNLKAPADMNMESVRVRLVSADGGKSIGEMVCSSELVKSGYDMAPCEFEMQMPDDFEKWAENVLVVVEVTIGGNRVHYQHAASGALKRAYEWKLEAQERAKRRVYPAVVTEPTWLCHKATKGQYIVGEKRISGRSRSRCFDGVRKLVLLSEPAMLLCSEDDSDHWQVRRTEFEYRPKGLVSLCGKGILVWGTHRTDTPDQGIPYTVEVSWDGGESWLDFNIPPLDYLLLSIGESGTNEVLILSGIRLGRDGASEAQDWFELARSDFMFTLDGGFMEITGTSLLDAGRGRIKSRSLAPNGRSRAYVAENRWLDTSYTVYVAPDHDEIPLPAISVGVGHEPEIVWSKDSGFLGLRSKETGLFFGYYDVKTCASDRWNGDPASPASAKSRDKLAGFDEKTRALLGLDGDAKD